MHICAYLCEASGAYYQFAKVGCAVDHQNNDFQYITVSSCGPANKGSSAFGFSENSNFPIQYFNATHNNNLYTFNYFVPYGACYRTGSILSHKIKFFNFAHSQGYDVFNTHFGTGSFDGQSIIENGNVYNCTTSTIFRFCGNNKLSQIRFCKLTYTSGTSFESGCMNTDSLTVTDSIFDVRPIGYNSQVSLGLEVTYTQSVELISFLNEEIDRCLITTVQFSQSDDFTFSSVFTNSVSFSPSKLFTPSVEFSQSNKFTSSDIFSPSSEFSPSEKFTKSVVFSQSNDFTKSETFSESSEFTSSSEFSPSKEFTKSVVFSQSNKFTLSITFSPSNDFTKSETFSESSEFTSSSEFSPSDKFSSSSEFTSSFHFSPSLFKTKPFTQSSPFTPSFTFKPNATKHPDGFNYRADVIGKNSKNNASLTAIGVTAGVSFAFIGIATFLMIVYLRSKQKQLRDDAWELDEAFLNSDTETSESYSYSYYTYTYEPENEANDSHTGSGSYYYTDNSRSYSDFQGDILYSDEFK